jgi:hypothetical protein
MNKFAWLVLVKKYFKSVCEIWSGYYIIIPALRKFGAAIYSPFNMSKKNRLPCENLCEKNFPKSAKIGKNRKKSENSYLTNSVAYNNCRRLGNSEAVTEEP